MEKKRVLLVTEEMDPYLLDNQIATIARKLADQITGNGFDIRILMPKFGTINERRHRLHEVVRLSGINIIIDDDDFPLLIKVASLPGSRMQVYFLDNEDFYKRKGVYHDEDGKPYDDNAERAVFFCKGVLETVKKFGWPPDIIHCHGWFASLLPMYVKTAYKSDPVFANAKMVYSVYENVYEGNLGDSFAIKSLINKVELADLKHYNGHTNSDMHLGAIHYSDGVIIGDDKVAEDVINNIPKKKIVHSYTDPVDEKSYIEFYKKLLVD